MVKPRGIYRDFGQRELRPELTESLCRTTLPKRSHSYYHDSYWRRWGFIHGHFHFVSAVATQPVVKTDIQVERRLKSRTIFFCFLARSRAEFFQTTPEILGPDSFPLETPALSTSTVNRLRVETPVTLSSLPESRPIPILLNKPIIS